MLNKDQGHLPFVPFVIRYMFAPCLPCIPHDYEPRFDNESRSPFAPTNPQPSPTKFQTAVDHLWDNVTVEADVRTIHISCHVNSNYSLDEFQNATLMPFDVMNNSLIYNQSRAPLTTTMPQLMERNTVLFAMIQNLYLEVKKSHAADVYRTEKCCCHCKRDWGVQSELLGRAYVLRKLDIEYSALVRSKQQSDFMTTINTMPLMLKRVLLDDDSPREQAQSTSSQLDRIRQLIYVLQTDYLLSRKANRVTSKKELAFLTLCDQYLDATYSDIQECMQVIEKAEGGQTTNHAQLWRTRGVYKYARSTDSALFDADIYDANNNFKPEPNDLRKFRLLEHGSGVFNFGKQDDINHNGSTNRASQHTDMFHNNAFQGLMAALAMVGKPESLTGHGIYDRVENPGDLIRCPSYPCDVFFRQAKDTRVRAELMERALRLIKKWTTKLMSNVRNNQVYWKDINLEMNDLDPDGLRLVTLREDGFIINFHTTMAHFISKVSLPGQGRLLLSSPPGDHEGEVDTVSLYSRVQPYSKIIFPSLDQDNENSSDEARSDIQSNHQNQQPQPNDHVGMLELNIVWLIARHLGWTVDDDRSRGAILVDRRILVAVQWFSNTIMTFSLLGSLLSRRFKLVKTIPPDFHFFGGPLKISYSEMRFWTAEECGFAALIVFGFYFILGRLSERNVSRTYEREMRDSIQERPPKTLGVAGRMMWRISRWIQDIYDRICPWMVQKMLFAPRWNRRSRQEVMDNTAFQRSIDYREHR